MDHGECESGEMKVAGRNWQPKVSIIIPVYNGSEYLASAIDSALAQTYENIEVLVVNDGSDDGGATERIAMHYHGRVRYFAKKNGGVSSALNFGVKMMAGEYFAWLSHDDLFCVDKIKVQINALFDKGAYRSAVYCDYAVFSDFPGNATSVNLTDVAPEQFRFWLASHSSLHGCTLLLPKLVFDECGYFDESLRTTQDYDFWFRVAKKYRFLHTPTVLVKARIHSRQGSISMAELALRESRALAVRMVQELSSEEIKHCGGVPIGETYLGLAVHQWRRGFFEAGAIAGRLSRVGGVGAFRFEWTRGATHCQYLGLSVLRKFFSPHTRLRVRNALKRFCEIVCT